MCFSANWCLTKISTIWEYICYNQQKNQSSMMLWLKSPPKEPAEISCLIVVMCVCLLSHWCKSGAIPLKSELESLTNSERTFSGNWGVFQGRQLRRWKWGLYGRFGMGVCVCKALQTQCWSNTAEYTACDGHDAIIVLYKNWKLGNWPIPFFFTGITCTMYDHTVGTSTLLLGVSLAARVDRLTLARLELVC